jgi:hypothetical protein
MDQTGKTCVFTVTTTNIAVRSLENISVKARSEAYSPSPLPSPARREGVIDGAPFRETRERGGKGKEAVLSVGDREDGLS